MSFGSFDLSRTACAFPGDINSRGPPATLTKISSYFDAFSRDSRGRSTYALGSNSAGTRSGSGLPSNYMLNNEHGVDDDDDDDDDDDIDDDDDDDVDDDDDDDDDDVDDDDVDDDDIKTK